jgi:hypothetical protein
MVADDCVTSGDGLPSIIDGDDAANMAVCYDGHTFFVGYPSWQGIPRGAVAATNIKLHPLPGGTNDVLDGTNWSGITLEDFVIRYSPRPPVFR